MRIIVFEALYWGPPILGNNYVVTTSVLGDS